MQILNDHHFEESVWCEMKCEGNNLVIGTIYRTPSSSRENNNLLLDVFNVCENYSVNTQILLCGDFNYRAIDWDSNYVDTMSNLFDCLFQERKDFADVSSFWEWVKYNIRKHSISYSRQQAFLKRRRGQKLENDLNEARAIFDNNPTQEAKLKLQTLQILRSKN